MGTWSTVCTTFFAKRILGFIEKRVNFFQADKAALNVYCLRAPSNVIDPDVCHKLHDHVSKKLTQSIDKDQLIVYPLFRKEFVSELWQTSTKLLVSIEARTSDSEDFNQEFNLITRFIANGGHVMLLIDPPNDSLSGNRSEFGTILSDPLTDVSERFVTNGQSGVTWQWSIQSSIPHLELDSSPDKQRTRILVGSGSDGSQLTVRVVVMLVDCVNQHPHMLLEALRLLNIPCANSLLNPHSEIETKASADRIVMHYLVGPNEQAITPEKMQSNLLTLKNNANETQYAIQPIYSSDPSLPAGFSWTEYLSTLKTHVLGRALLWAESLPSSYSLGERLLPTLPADSGLVIVSNQQTEGKGRGSNRWISLIGQASFTFHMTLRRPCTITPDSNASFPFMNLVTLMQHVVALAIVFASRRIIAGRLGLVRTEDPEPEPESLANLKLPGPAIRVKWPNDVYVVDDEIRSSASGTKAGNRGILGKLAGLLTKCTMVDSRQVDFISGVGINVQNVIPSICLQQVLDDVQPTAVSITTAEVIAQVLNQLERLIMPVVDPKSTRDLDWLLDLYTKCWIHENQRVLVQTPPVASGDNPRACIIVGLDKFGYLRVRDACDGAEYTLHPDGNSMDMMRGLIRPK